MCRFHCCWVESAGVACVYELDNGEEREVGETRGKDSLSDIGMDCSVGEECRSGGLDDGTVWSAGDDVWGCNIFGDNRGIVG